MSTHDLQLRLNDVHWSGHDQTIPSFDLSLPPGSVTGIVGPSGCGKSTLLRAIAGRDTRIQGRITRHHLLPDANPSKLTTDDCVLLTQDAQDVLMPWYQVRTYWSILSQGNHKPNDSTLTDLGASVGLHKHELNKRPTTLSGGQRRRVALVASVLRRPKLLLLDEPFAGLDFDVKVLALDLLRTSIGSPPEAPTHCDAVIIVSHSLEDVATVCDTVHIMNPHTPGGMSVHTEERGFKPFKEHNTGPDFLKSVSHFEHRLRSRFPLRSSP